MNWNLRSIGKGGGEKPPSFYFDRRIGRAMSLASLPPAAAGIALLIALGVLRGHITVVTGIRHALWNQ